MKIDPIIAVKDVEQSAKWYQAVFQWVSIHGGSQFDVLTSKQNEVMLCLHKWGEHDHPTMQHSNMNGGNGLILYFRIENLDQIREKLRSINYTIENEIEVSANSHKREFSFRDPDGYYITMADFHKYRG